MLFAIFVRIFFGIPPDSEHFTRLQTLYRVIDFRNSARASYREVSRALDEVTVINYSTTDHSIIAAYEAERGSEL